MKPTPNQLYVYNGSSPVFDKIMPKRLTPRIVRYARNVEINDVTKVFLILTDETDITRIVAFFTKSQSLLRSGDYPLDETVFENAEAEPQMLSFAYEGRKK